MIKKLSFYVYATVSRSIKTIKPTKWQGWNVLYVPHAHIPRSQRTTAQQPSNRFPLLSAKRRKEMWSDIYIFIFLDRFVVWQCIEYSLLIQQKNRFMRNNYVYVVCLSFTFFLHFISVYWPQRSYYSNWYIYLYYAYIFMIWPIIWFIAGNTR